MGNSGICEACGWRTVTGSAGTGSTCACNAGTCCKYARVEKERAVYFGLVCAVFDNKPLSYIQALASDITSKFEGWFWINHCGRNDGICETCLTRLTLGYNTYDALLEASRLAVADGECFCHSGPESAGRHKLGLGPGPCDWCVAKKAVALAEGKE